MNITLFICSSFLLTIILWFVGIKISLSSYYNFEIKLFAFGYISYLIIEIGLITIYYIKKLFKDLKL